MRDRFTTLVGELLDSDPRVAVVLAEIGAASLDEAIRRHPRRLINVGIREQLMIGVTAGFALAGYRPIAHSYAPFVVERPFEQVKLDLAHQGVAAVLVSVGGSYDWTEGGRTHHAPEDVALVATLPGWQIFVPGHPDEAETLLRAAVDAEGSSYLRLSLRSNARPVAVDPGRFTVVRRGSGGTIIAVGPMLDPVLAATRERNETVLYAATVRPFDEATLLRELQGSSVVLVEPYLEGTSAAVVSRALVAVPHRLLAVGVPPVEHRRYGTPEEHDRAYGIDASGLRRRIDAFLGAAAGSDTRGRVSRAG